MQIEYVKTYDEMSQKAARSVAQQILLKPESVLGFATGFTPEGMYARLVELYQEGLIDFSKVTTFNLDEYVGLSPDHLQSYHFFMWDRLFGKLNISKEKVYLPDGNVEDVQKSCLIYEEAIQSAGGIDLQVLGIGPNGHIGFNEPGSDLSGMTHVVELTPSTRKANARFFDSVGAVPQKAISMGIKTIMNARRILLLGSGSGKWDIIQKTLHGPITSMIPASILQLHPDVTVIIDQSTTGLK
ncbi:MAG: glucosamine-6-phosphate deaminase [Atribacterota bacterium]